MPFAKTNGVDMYYEVYGQGPALVLAHPGGGNHLSWWQQVPVFAQTFTCITCDHRGHGYTRDLPDDPGAAAYAEDLAGLLDHLGIRKEAIIGQSMGGWTAVGFAVAYPERLNIQGGYSSYCLRSSWISYQGTFERNQTCSLGRASGFVSSVPMAMVRTSLRRVGINPNVEPHLMQKIRFPRSED